MVYITCMLCLVAGGVLGRYGIGLSWEWYGLAAGVLCGWLLCRYSRWSTIVLAAGLGCLMAGRMVASLPDPSFRVSDYGGRKLIISGVVSSPPEQGVRSLQVRLSQIEVEGVEVAWQGGLQILLPVHSQVGYGDYLKLRGQVRDIAEIEAGYSEYLYYHQVYGTMVWPEVLDRVPGGHGDLVGWGIWLRQQSMYRIQRLLPQDLAALLMGVVLGSKQLLSDRFDEALAITGTSHIVVASGYNVAILCGLTARLVARWGKYAVMGGSCLLVGGFLLLSGLDPSLIRASLMAGLAIMAVSVGRQKQVLYFLFVAAAIMLCLNPWWLYDIGFQLSFMATLSIVLFEPIIRRHSPGGLPVWLREIVSPTLAAQILVYPLIGVLFGSWSVVSLLTNLLVLWVVPWLMMGGFILVIASWLGGWLAWAVAYAVYPMLSYMRQIIILTSNIPGASLAAGFSWWGVGLYYAMACVVICKWGSYEHKV